jgi:transcriptional regulator with XRE-family HTH domain
MPFNEKLRALREKAELTQEALARATNLSVSTIVKLERGGMDPSWSTVQRLAKSLGVDCTAFEDGERPRKGK